MTEGLEIVDMDGLYIMYRKQQSLQQSDVQVAP